MMWAKIWLSAVFFMIGGIFAATVRDWQIEKTIGNDIFNMKNLKRDCEKDLPRSEECVLVYEFTPVKTKGEK